MREAAPGSSVSGGHLVQCDTPVSGGHLVQCDTPVSGGHLVQCEAPVSGGHLVQCDTPVSGGHLVQCDTPVSGGHLVQCEAPVSGGHLVQCDTPVSGGHLVQCDAPVSGGHLVQYEAPVTVNLLVRRVHPDASPDPRAAKQPGGRGRCSEEAGMRAAAAAAGLVILAAVAVLVLHCLARSALSVEGDTHLGAGDAGGDSLRNSTYMDDGTPTVNSTAVDNGSALASNETDPKVTTEAADGCGALQLPCLQPGGASSRGECPRYYSPAQWSAQPPAVVVPMLHPIRYVVVSHTAMKRCSSLEACGKQLRSMQHYHLKKGYDDLTYNFVVGNDGSVYAGRGWWRASSHLKQRGNVTLGVSFFGDYSDQSLTELQVNSTALLLEQGVKCGYLAPDYQLVAHNQTHNTNSPGLFVFREIQNWPHYSPIKLFYSEVTMSADVRKGDRPIEPTDSDSSDDSSTWEDHGDVTSDGVSVSQARTPGTAFYVQQSKDVQVGPRAVYQSPVTFNQNIVVTSGGVAESPGASDLVSGGLFGALVSYEGGAPVVVARKKGLASCRARPFFWGLLVAAALLAVAAGATVLSQPAVLGLSRWGEGEPTVAPLEYPVSGNKTLDNGRRILSKKEWGGRDPRNATWLVHPTKYVVISHTAGNLCFDVHTCAAIVRGIQEYHRTLGALFDISYNFLVGGDGNVYEGRGWDFRSAQTGFVSGDNVDVGLIGNFVWDSPSHVQTDSVQQLIKRGVDLGKLDPNYKLVAHNQTFSTISPGPNVYRLISKWPHFYVPSAEDPA
ncbi:uncharacterized protein LOC134540663 [Bacillus rossius redtenbacheri]|uniref:uncharacterized protein LOC134540663 n=1 Tax=Bacillus rossius redtenbacheri TaxID=93214 RepID=UPI002FDF044C